MPTFPTYDGELPQCLNPLNPRHYLLVLYWVFFRPTALKCYLYKANSESYKSRINWRNLWQHYNIVAYRNLYIIQLTSPFLAAFLISISTVFLNNIFHNLDSHLNSWSHLNSYLLYLLISMLAASLPGLFFGKIELISASIMLAGIFASIAFPLFKLTGSEIIAGLFFGCSGRAYLDIKISVQNKFNLVGISLSAFLFFDLITANFSYGIWFLLGNLMGLTGFLVYPFQVLILLVFPHFRKKQHPANWDELTLIPLPFLEKYFSSRLYLPNEEEALTGVVRALNKTSQAKTAQKALALYLKTENSPIESIYYWASLTALNEYIQVPILNSDWHVNGTLLELLFLELVRNPYNFKEKINFKLKLKLLFLRYKQDGFKSVITFFIEVNRCCIPLELFSLVLLFHKYLAQNRFIQSLEYSLKETRYKKKSEVSQYLIWRDRILNDQFSLIEFNIPPQIQHYPYGVEVYKSFSMIETYLQFQTPQQIATTPTHLTWLQTTDTFLRPTVIQALQTFSTISQQVNRANIASSPLNQRNAILIANAQLQQLTTYITENVHPNYPEQKLLLRIVYQWQSIITKAGGELGRAELLEPIENPYIAGPPVTGNLFIGREDILTTIEELWLKPGQVESIVIYGHRRMGKTSILRNLSDRFTPTTKIINFNIQTLGTLTTPQLILALAQTIYDDLPPHIQIPEPTQSDFPTPERDFRRWLKKLEPMRQPDDRFIIAIDEFELIEQGIKAGRLSPSLIGHWRGILNDFPWIIFAFAGLHTLQEMTTNYWNPLFGSVRKIPVTYLTQAAATRLITNPSEDFPIDYDPDAIAQIYSLTNGQPYLTQLICQNLISRFNRQRFEEQREIEPRFTLADIQTIITEPNFFNDGNAYFRGIWEQAQETSGPTQLAILRELAIAPAATLQAQAAEDFALALDLLLTHDVIHQDDQSRYSYRVELMRQWVQKTLPN
jgi:hypothetical protein